MGINSIKVFENRKKEILNKQEHGLDKSYKGSIDNDIVSNIKELNKCKYIYTTSSCSGRISIYGTTDLFKKKWQLCTHEIVNDYSTISKEQYENLYNMNEAWQLFEPFIQTLEVENFTIGNAILRICIQNGYRESGMHCQSKRWIVSIRDISLSARIPIIYNSINIIDPNDIHKYIVICNEKLTANSIKRDKLLSLLCKEFAVKNYKEINNNSISKKVSVSCGHAAVACDVNKEDDSTIEYYTKDYITKGVYIRDSDTKYNNTNVKNYINRKETTNSIKINGIQFVKGKSFKKIKEVLYKLGLCESFIKLEYISPNEQIKQTNINIPENILGKEYFCNIPCLLETEIYKDIDINKINILEILLTPNFTIKQYNDIKDNDNSKQYGIFMPYKNENENQNIIKKDIKKIKKIKYAISRDTIIPYWYNDKNITLVARWEKCNTIEIQNLLSIESNKKYIIPIGIWNISQIKDDDNTINTKNYNIINKLEDISDILKKDGQIIIEIEIDDTIIPSYRTEQEEWLYNNYNSIQFNKSIWMNIYKYTKNKQKRISNIGIEQPKNFYNSPWFWQINKRNKDEMYMIYNWQLNKKNIYFICIYNEIKNNLQRTPQYIQQHYNKDSIKYIQQKKSDIEDINQVPQYIQLEYKQYSKQFWITIKENNIKYVWEQNKSMFCKGNVYERMRMKKLPYHDIQCKQETNNDNTSNTDTNINNNKEIVVDQYGGIGYYSQPQQCSGMVSYLYICDQNIWSQQGFNRSCKQNNISKDMYNIILCDNREYNIKYLLKNKADRVIQGQLPSSEEGYETGLLSQKDKGGILHIHRCINKYEKILEGTKLVNKQNMLVMDINVLWKDTINILNIQYVKSYAPHIYHVVYDITVGNFLIDKKIHNL